MSKKKLIKVDATGTASIPYDHAVLRTTVSATSTTGRFAKETIESSVKKIHEYLDELVSQKAISNLVFSTKVSPFDDRRTPRSGIILHRYEASHTIKFSIINLPLVAEIQDTISDISLTTVSAPKFDISDPEDAKSKALVNAWERVKSRQAAQWNAAGFSKYSANVSHWDANLDPYEGMGKMSAPKNKASGVGLMLVKVDLTVYYIAP